ncbi:hypothetical protein [Burkholderia ambifaria]|uniref:hypothetical protein n=1 Tax=Burkholderia ambifaria TaxID=152480 RepID=UPI000A4FAED8|nr:hypothetical protein [Burkholderia ambifaria]
MFQLDRARCIECTNATREMHRIRLFPAGGRMERSFAGLLAERHQSERIAVRDCELIKYDGKNEMAIHAIIREWPLRKLQVNA